MKMEVGMVMEGRWTWGGDGEGDGERDDGHGASEDKHYMCIGRDA